MKCGTDGAGSEEMQTKWVHGLVKECLTLIAGDRAPQKRPSQRAVAVGGDKAQYSAQAGRRRRRLPRPANSWAVVERGLIGASCSCRDDCCCVLVRRHNMIASSLSKTRLSAHDKRALLTCAGPQDPGDLHADLLHFA